MHIVDERPRPLQPIQLLERCLAQLNNVVMITEAEPLDEPGPRIVFVNEAFERLTGYGRDEVVGRSPRFLQGPATDADELKRLGAALRRWEPVRSELVNYKKSGEPFWLEMDIVPVADDSGWFTHWVAVERDVTGKKRAERALGDSERRFRGVIDASPVPYALNDDHGNITFLNPAFVRTFGYTLDDIPTLADWWMLAYPDEDYRHWVVQSWTERLDATARTGGPFEPLEVRIRCKDGSFRIVMTEAAAVSGSFDNTFLVILVDVTESRRLELGVIDAATREQHRLGLDLHDGLGQELTGLAMMLDALARRIAIDRNFDPRNDLAEIGKIASRCVASTRSIAHDLSPVALGSGGFADALKRLIANAKTLAPVEIDLSIAGMPPQGVTPKITEAVYRVVQEALSNAISHGRATRLQIAARFGRANLTITVTDDGCGIPAGARHDGLGLHIMRYRARALGGRLEIKRRPEGGTIVRCICPLPR